MQELFGFLNSINLNIIIVIALITNIGKIISQGKKITNVLDNIKANTTATQQLAQDMIEVKAIATQNKDANCEFSGNILYTRCHEHLKKNEITREEYCYLLRFYEQYCKLGGNGTISRLWIELTILAKQCGVDTDSCLLK